jgi:hypothetical protein
VRIEATSPAPMRLPYDEDASQLVSFGTLRGRVGASVDIHGTVYGTGPYTDDSWIASAAVHAGLLKPGETGVIRVVVERGLDAYPSSNRNGVTTASYGSWHGSIRLERTR